MLPLPLSKLHADSSSGALCRLLVATLNARDAGDIGARSWGERTGDAGGVRPLERMTPPPPPPKSPSPLLFLQINANVCASATRCAAITPASTATAGITVCNEKRGSLAIAAGTTQTKLFIRVYQPKQKLKPVAIFPILSMVMPAASHTQLPGAVAMWGGPYTCCVKFAESSMIKKSNSPFVRFHWISV